MIRKRVIRAWLALCRDERQRGHGLATLRMRREDFKKHFGDEAAGYNSINLDEKLSVEVHGDEQIDKGTFQIVAGNLYMFLPFAPDNIQLLAEMTGNWPIHGWWKQKDPWNLMMKPR